MNQLELGKLIFELRQKKGFTQSELAEMCNISLRTVQRIELAEVTPRKHTVKLILNALDFNYENLKSLSIQQEIISNSKSNWFEQLKSHIKELFNLKRNTMKKISLLSLIVILITTLTFLSTNKVNAQSIDGWFISGSKKESYNIGLDKSTFQSGGVSAYIESNADETKIKGFGTLMQTCSADNYLGKRVKMTAYIKTKGVINKAGMWMRVDSKEPRETLSFDNMSNRPIKGDTDWKKYEIILDVPENSDRLNFGVLINDIGKAWIDNISFEIVDKAKPTTTNAKRTIPTKPMNLDFSN